MIKKLSIYGPAGYDNIRSRQETYEYKYPIGVSFPSLRRFLVFLFRPIEVHGKERARSIRVAGLCLGFSTGSGQRWVLDVVKKVLGGFWRGKL